MKRFLLLLISAILVCIPTLTASAENVSLHENLALALQSADIRDIDGNTLTAQIISEDESSDVVSVSIMRGEDEVSADEAVSINFDGANLNVTSADFESFDVFSGLEELRIALPDSFSGEFLPSFDKLSLLDVSGSSADFTLSLYNSVNVVSVDASECENLKAVNLGLVQPKTEGGMFGSGTECEILSSPLSKLTELKLSNNPNLDRVGYLLASSGGGMGGLFGGNGATYSGYKAHSLITSVKATTYYPDDTSHPEREASSNPLESMFMGGGSTNLGSYEGDTVNLVPSLISLDLTDSGTSENNQISFIDISDSGKLVTAKFSGMTMLQYITLPSGNTLKALNLSGDTALLALDLSGTKGFIWPEGFQTLTGLKDFRMTRRDEIDSVDVSKFTGLISLDVSNNTLSAIDLESNKVLENLYLANNSIYSLDLGGHTTLKNIDVRNNRLVKIDISKNLGLRVNYNSPENSTASLSSQTRYMTGNRVLSFCFRDIGLSSIEFANIVAESVKGEGVSVTEFDPLGETVRFSAFPSVVTYDYMTGIYYEGDTRPVCMSVRLVWDVSGNPPALSPMYSEIHGQVGKTADRVTIMADSETPVTWTTSPDVLPAGLAKIPAAWTLTISGEPKSAYSGIVEVTAANENGVSEPAAVEMMIEAAIPEGTTPNGTISGDAVITSDDTIPDGTVSDDTENTNNILGVSSSGGGCYAVNLGMIALAFMIMRRKN